MIKSTKTIESNSIRYMLRHVEGYEQVKEKKHPQYKNAREYFEAKGICYQNFYKFLKRYIESGKDPTKLLPMRRGPKARYTETVLSEGSLEEIVI